MPSRWAWPTTFVVMVVVGTTLVGLATRQANDSRNVDVVAWVDSHPITRDELDAYAAALTTSNGRQVLTQDYVLLALVNQALALREADRLGVLVSEDALDELVSEAMKDRLIGRLVSREGGVEAYRARLRTKLRFDRVKEIVTAGVRPSEEMIRSYFDAHRADYPSLRYEEVRYEISTILEGRMVTDRWRDWLAKGRACAAIEVVDERLVLPPETYETECSDGTGNE